MKKNNSIIKNITTVIIIVLVLSIIPATICIFKDNIKLKMLSYSNKSINKIKNYDLTKYVIKKNRYSKTFDKAILSKEFILKNKDVYYKLDYIDDSSYISNINDLTAIGYKDLNLKLIFKYLSNNQINNLKHISYIDNIKEYIVYDYLILDNMDRYINYKNKYPDLALSNVITYVNIGIDNSQYTNIINISDYNSKKLLVNKYNKLPSDFIPSKLIKVDSNFSTKNIELAEEANEAFNKLCLDASVEQLDIKAVSGYRSYATQLSLYNAYVKKDGVAKADTYSARAGHSEHQTGLAVDISGSGLTFDEFGNSEEFNWVKINAHKYGFIIRYPKDKEHITLYKYEPWHLRYVGKDIATDVFNKNITYDEYYIRYLNK